jgi:hypothetical protein
VSTTVIVSPRRPAIPDSISITKIGQTRRGEYGRTRFPTPRIIAYAANRNAQVLGI